MKLNLHAESDPGKMRDHNEDMVIAGNILFRDDRCSFTVELEPGRAFFAGVADGMGGHQAGEVASGTAARAIATRINTFNFSGGHPDLASLFSGWIRDIHHALVADGTANPERTGMGTTLVGLFVLDGRFYLANAGDSRLYLLRGRKLTRLSRDHSLRELSGLSIIPSNILANSIGAADDVFTDFDEIIPAPRSGDTFLLCSDGLSDMLRDEEIEALLTERKDTAAGALVEQANLHGGADNISVVTVRVE